MALDFFKSLNRHFYFPGLPQIFEMPDLYFSSQFQFDLKILNEM